MKAKIQFFSVHGIQTSIMLHTKAELQQVGIFFPLNFLPWDFLLIQKLEIKEKTRPPSIQLLKLI